MVLTSEEDPTGWNLDERHSGVPATHKSDRPVINSRWVLHPVSIGVVAVVIVLITAITLGRIWFSGNTRTSGSVNVPITEQSVDRPTASATSSPPSNEDENAARITVYVTGAVTNPQIIELSSGQRVADAISAAGGPKADAALEYLNLARLVEDGEQIHVPTVEQVEAGDLDSLSQVGVGEQPGADNECVNINTADVQRLQDLDGIGPSLAQRIVDHRDQYGSFANNESLMEVSGIGAKKYQTLLAKLCG